MNKIKKLWNDVNFLITAQMIVMVFVLILKIYNLITNNQQLILQ